jgi:hypothetical protein
MNILFRNFFYGVGFISLFFLYQADPNTATFGDLVRLVQSARAQQLLLVITVLLIALEFACGSSLIGRTPAMSSMPSKTKAQL